MINEPNFDLVLLFGAVVLTFAVVSAWIVTRPFERARRKARRAREHAAE